MTTTEKEPKASAKYTGSPRFIPGVPARDLTEQDYADFDGTTMELLRRDAESESPMYEHSKALGHSEFYKASEAAKKADKAAAKKGE